VSEKFDLLLDKLVSTAEALGVAENARHQAEAREQAMKIRLGEREAEIVKLKAAMAAIQENNGK
jgi:hypothetical protein